MRRSACLLLTTTFSPLRPLRCSSDHHRSPNALAPLTTMHRLPNAVAPQTGCRTRWLLRPPPVAECAGSSDHHAPVAECAGSSDHHAPVAESPALSLFFARTRVLAASAVGALAVLVHEVQVRLQPARNKTYVYQAHAKSSIYQAHAKYKNICMCIICAEAENTLEME